MARKAKRGAKKPRQGGKALPPSREWTLFPTLFRPVSLPKNFRPRGNVGRADNPLEPPPRRRGPPPDTQRWFSICAEIARRCIDAKTSRVQVPKSENKLADEVLDWLAENGQGQPATSEMREAVRRICASLRTMQK
jgi:hypothetical protein